MKDYILDFTNINSIEEVHKYIKNMLHFEDYYGENLDALNDCLSELEEYSNIIIKTNEEKLNMFESIINVFENCENIDTIVELDYDEQ